MNLCLILAFVLGGGTIATDHLIHRLPSKVAVILYTAAVILFIAGMIISKNAGA